MMTCSPCLLWGWGSVDAQGKPIKEHATYSCPSDRADLWAKHVAECPTQKAASQGTRGV